MPGFLNTIGSTLGNVAKAVPPVLGAVNRGLQESALQQNPAAYAKIQGQRQEQASQKQYALAFKTILDGLTMYGSVEKAMQDPEVQQAMALFVQNPQKMQSLQIALDIYKPKKDTESEISNL